MVLVRAAVAKPSVTVDGDDATADVIILSAVDGTTPPLILLRVSDGAAAVARVVAVDAAAELSLSIGREADTAILGAIDGNTPPLTILRVSDRPIVVEARVVAIDAAAELSLSIGR